MRKILYLIETLGHGGAEHQLTASVRRLDRTRYEPVVCHFRRPDYLAATLRSAGIQVHCLNVPPGKQHWPELALSVSSLLRRERPDLIHTSLFEADIIGGLAGRLAHIPVVSTLCNIAGDPVRLVDNPRNSTLKFVVANWMWGGSLRSWHAHSIAISEAVLKSTADTFGVSPSRMSVIYRGIDDEQKPPRVDVAAFRAENGVSDASPLLLSVGRLAPQKGHKYLIAALPKLVARFPKAQLLIVGEGWLGSDIEAQARALGVEQHVRLLGKRTDVRELMLACDIFVFPSLFEGLGVSLLEAAYLGCACVASDVGPIPEIITNNLSGLLVPPQNSEALSAALLELAGDPALREKISRQASADTRRRFMLSDKVVELERCYERVLDSPH